jgi:hypothetical protein
MQLKERNGIACDHCGTTYRHDFLYYSFDIRYVAVIANRRPSLDMIFQTNIIFSLDICSICFDKISADIVKNYSKILSAQRRTRIETVCEISGAVLLGDYIYYHINVTKATVRTSGQPHICVKCKTKTMEPTKPCSKCQGSNFYCPASVSAIDRFVEVNISEEVYKRFTELAGKMRQVAGQWSTES